MRTLRSLVMAALVLGAAIGISSSASATIEPIYSPNSNPVLGSQSSTCLVWQSQFNAGAEPCMRWQLYGGTYMQGLYRQWQGELLLVSQTCSFGYIYDATNTWHWVAMDTSGFCGAGSPTPFWKRSQGARI